MPPVFHGILSHLQRTKESEVNYVRFRLPLRLQENPIHVLPQGGFRQLVAESPCNLAKLLHFHTVRLVMNPVDRRHSVLSQMPGDSLIRREHEFFNESFGLSLAYRLDARDVAVLAEQDFGFGHVENHGPPVNPSSAKHRRQFRHFLQDVRERRLPFLRGYVGICRRWDRLAACLTENLVNLLKTEPAFAGNHGIEYLVLIQNDLFAEGHRHRLCQPVASFFVAA